MYIFKYWKVQRRHISCKYIHIISLQSRCIPQTQILLPASIFRKKDNWQKYFRFLDFRKFQQSLTGQDNNKNPVNSQTWVYLQIVFGPLGHVLWLYVKYLFMCASVFLIQLLVQTSEGMFLGLLGYVSAPLQQGCQTQSSLRTYK